MKAKSFDDMRCSVARSLDQVGSWWSLLIIRDALMGVRRFSSFEKSLGIAKNTLTKRLSELCECGIMQKAASRQGHSYAEYELTEKGIDLAPVLIALAQWGDKWAEHEEGRTFSFHDRQSGDEIPRLLPTRDSGMRIPFEELELRSHL